MINRITAGTLIFVLTLLVPMTPLAIKNAKAASVQKKYIKEVKTLTLEYDLAKNAQAWCDDQPENKDDDPDNDWSIVGENLNRGAQGSWHASSGAVYLAYRTTTDPSEAITDLAVMNEKGNYSTAAYEQILKNQKQYFKDMVSDTKDMLEEYRKNVENELPTAIMARDFMNGYKEDDSGELLGNLLLKVDDDKLSEILLQANGQVVLMIQEQLAYACDTGSSTWIDRMSTLGKNGNAYGKLLQAAKNSRSVLDKKYHEKAVELSENWDDVYQHNEHAKKYYKMNGIREKSEKELNEWIEANKDDPEYMAINRKTSFRE